MSTLLDALILGWLIGTWFYEGHHRRCSVIATCANCEREHEVDCDAGKR